MLLTDTQIPRAPSPLNTPAHSNLRPNLRHAKRRSTTLPPARYVILEHDDRANNIQTLSHDGARRSTTVAHSRPYRIGIADILGSVLDALWCGAVRGRSAWQTQRSGVSGKRDPVLRASLLVVPVAMMEVVEGFARVTCATPAAKRFAKEGSVPSARVPVGGKAYESW